MLLQSPPCRAAGPAGRRRCLPAPPPASRGGAAAAAEGEEEEEAAAAGAVPGAGGARRRQQQRGAGGSSGEATVGAHAGRAVAVLPGGRWRRLRAGGSRRPPLALGPPLPVRAPEWVPRRARAGARGGGGAGGRRERVARRERGVRSGREAVGSGGGQRPRGDAGLGGARPREPASAPLGRLTSAHVPALPRRPAGAAVTAAGLAGSRAVCLGLLGLSRSWMLSSLLPPQPRPDLDEAGCPFYS